MNANEDGHSHGLQRITETAHQHSPEIQEIIEIENAIYALQLVDGDVDEQAYTLVSDRVKSYVTEAKESGDHNRILNANHIWQLLQSRKESLNFDKLLYRLNYVESQLLTADSIMLSTLSSKLDEIDRVVEQFINDNDRNMAPIKQKAAELREMLNTKFDEEIFGSSKSA